MTLNGFSANRLRKDRFPRKATAPPPARIKGRRPPRIAGPPPGTAIWHHGRSAPVFHVFGCHKALPPRRLLAAPRPGDARLVRRSYPFAPVFHVIGCHKALPPRHLLAAPRPGDTRLVRRSYPFALIFHLSGCRKALPLRRRSPARRPFPPLSPCPAARI